MALKCDVCSKKTAYGIQQIHRHSRWRFRAPQTKRTWVPNIRPVKVAGKEETVEIKMCMSCYKRYSKDGVKFLTKKKVKALKNLTLV